MKNESLFDEHVINKYPARRRRRNHCICVCVFFSSLKANIENESFIVAVAISICHLMILSGSRWCVSFKQDDFSSRHRQHTQLKFI